MPELRHDHLMGRHVLLAPARHTRPFTSHGERSAADDPSSCPFCPGREHETPPELARTGDATRWRVRVFPNLYPIVSGAHEVVVLSPDHHRAFGALDDRQAVEVLQVMRERARRHRDAGLAYTQLFVNQGRAAGASLAHPHAQVLALELVPPAVELALGRFVAAGFDLVIGDLEAAQAHDLVVLDGAATAWCPDASTTPFEVRVALPEAGAHFADTSDDEVSAVAVAVRDVLAALARALDDPPYNVVVHDAPNRDPRIPRAGHGNDHRDEYHWWIEIVPRVSIVAGFEMGTGLFVNTVDPTNASHALRGAHSAG